MQFLDLICLICLFQKVYQWLLGRSHSDIDLCWNLQTIFLVYIYEKKIRLSGFLSYFVILIRPFKCVQFASIRLTLNSMQNFDQSISFPPHSQQHVIQDMREVLLNHHQIEWRSAVFKTCLESTVRWKLTKGMRKKLLSIDNRELKTTTWW